MFLSIIRYIRGYVCIRVIGYSAERFLNACSHRGIYLWGLHPADGAYEMYLSVKGFRQLKPIIKKTGTKVVIVRRFGLPFFLHKYRKRKMFFIGAVSCLTIIYLLSIFIWNIDIRGNMSRTDESLLTFLKTKNVKYGMKKSTVDCARIVKDIRKEYDDIIWVSASIEGTKLIIQVKENEDSLPALTEKSDPEEEPAPQDIIADKDCVITGMIVRNGLAVVKEGDEVKKGDILVCGRVPINNDGGETIDYQYHVSDADITGQTTIPYEDSHSLTYTVKKDSGIKKEELYLKVGGYRIGLGSIKNKYKHFELTNKETDWRLGKDFYLPVSSGSRIVRPYTPQTKSYTKEELQNILTRQFSKHCKDLEKKGVEIIENDVKIYTGQREAKASGTLTVKMPIGEKSPTEIVEVPADNEQSQESGDNIDGNDGNTD